MHAYSPGAERPRVATALWTPPLEHFLDDGVHLRRRRVGGMAAGDQRGAPVGVATRPSRASTSIASARISARSFRP